MAFGIPAIRRLRSKLLAAANSVGVNRFIAETDWRRRRLLILCYHGISQHDEHEWSDLYVSSGHLERRLFLLRKVGANVLPLDDALELLKQGRLPQKAVSITFDDGSVDFALKAAPILRAANAPATLYLTTYYSGRQQPVFDTITSYLLWKSRGKPVSLTGILEGVVPNEGLAHPRFLEMHSTIRAFARVNGLDADQKDSLARELAHSVGVDYGEITQRRLLQIMTPSEVRALDRNLISVQLHTHRHRSPRDRETFTLEVMENAQIIRSLRGDSPALSHFCYPSGDHIPENIEWLKAAGVKWATTCIPGLASDLSNPYLLPRFVDSESISEATFLAWVSGLSVFAHPRTARTQQMKIPAAVNGSADN
jgi:peptidoglycan/xylan/chitin deacetylase (PgdA/CDA1 family)